MLTEMIGAAEGASALLIWKNYDQAKWICAEFIDRQLLLIAYQGSCTSCHSATGSTLSAIEQILQAKVFPDIKVVPDLASLQQG